MNIPEIQASSAEEVCRAKALSKSRAKGVSLVISYRLCEYQPMPRPQRIEYENAFYHIMNRGRERKAIFHGEAYYQAFLTTLAEAADRFRAVIHIYRLMGNHYHLPLETPDANLSRIMQHVDGVYT